MKILLYPLLGLLMPVAFVSQRSSLIDWKADHKLQWDDFKARPDRNSPNAALTSTTVTFDFSYNGQRMIYHVHCQFDKNLSWGRVKNDYILSHEQGHFDITEIFARKLNKLLKDYTIIDVNKAGKEINKLYENTMKQLNEMQNKYDNETNFSINKAQQEEWLKKISVELKDLEEYANYNN